MSIAWIACIEPNPHFFDDRELETGCDSLCNPTDSDPSTSGDGDLETADATSSIDEPNSSNEPSLSTGIETNSPSDSNSPDPGTETESPPPVWIDFDEDGPALDYFSDMDGPTSDEYQEFGVYFEGPRAGDGAAIISDDTWPISGHTPPNIFGFNCGMRFRTGGRACGPVTILFSPPATRVTMLAGTGAIGVRLTATAYDELGDEVDTHEMPIGNAFTGFALEGNDIARIVFDAIGNSGILAIDDLEVSYEK